MESILKALDCAYEDGDFAHELIEHGDTPDEVFAGLVRELGRLDPTNEWEAGRTQAEALAKSSFERINELLADALDVDAKDVARLFMSAVIIMINEWNAEPAPQTPWSWPVVNERPGKGGFDGTYREFSALKMFGYTVGKTDGWADPERRKFLSDFMRMDLPPVVEQEFPGEYGAPMSTDRLRKVATHIASVCSSAAKRDPHRNRFAIADWKADLAFLKEAFYEGEGLKFRPWPSIDTRT